MSPRLGLSSRSRRLDTGTHGDPQGPTGTHRDPQGPTGTHRDPQGPTGKNPWEWLENGFRHLPAKELRGGGILYRWARRMSCPWIKLVKHICVCIGCMDVGAATQGHIK